MPRTRSNTSNDERTHGKQPNPPPTKEPLLRPSARSLPTTTMFHVKHAKTTTPNKLEWPIVKNPRVVSHL